MFKSLTRTCDKLIINSHPHHLRPSLRALAPTHTLINSQWRNFAQDLAMQDEEAADTGLESMSLLQYGDKQVYLFGSNADVKSSITDFQPDHIIFGLCQQRADKLREIINDIKSKNSGNSGPLYFPPFSCETYIKPDPEQKHRHTWKSTSLPKAVISACGLNYGNEYFDTLHFIDTENKDGPDITLINGDKPIQPIIDTIEVFLNEIEDSQGALEAKKAKLLKKAEKTPGVRPTGRQKASKSFFTRAKAETTKEIAKLDKDAEITLDNVADVFIDKEFMSETYPELYKGIYEDRDENFFNTIKKCQGDVIFAVMPDVHIDGIIDRLVKDDAMILM